MSTIPSRAQKKATVDTSTVLEDADTDTPVVEEKPKKLNLAGAYRVRDGYHVTYGDLDANGRHATGGPGTIVTLTHDEALSIIRATKDQKDGEGKSNGPAIETEVAYNARIEAQRQHDEFMKSLAEANNLPE